MGDAWDSSDGPAVDRFEPMYRAIFSVAGDLGSCMPVMALGVGGDSAVHQPGSVIKPRIEAQYAAAVADGEFRALPPAVVADIVAGMVDGALRHWLANPTAHRRRETLRTLIELSRAAFAP